MELRNEKLQTNRRANKTKERFQKKMHADSSKMAPPKFGAPSRTTRQTQSTTRLPQEPIVEA